MPNTSFLLQNPELSVAVVSHFMRKLADEEFFDAQLRAGASAELMDALRSRVTIDDALRAFSQYPGAIFVVIDDTRALKLLDGTRRATETDSRMEYLARHGATVDQLSRWYSLSTKATRELREALNVCAHGGRPARPPDVRRRDEIHAAWAAIREGTPERDAYWLLHHDFSDLTVATLASVVREHETDAARSPRAPDAGGQPEGKS